MSLRQAARAVARGAMAAPRRTPVPGQSDTVVAPMRMIRHRLMSDVPGASPARPAFPNRARTSHSSRRDP